MRAPLRLVPDCLNAAAHNDVGLGMPDGYMAREAWAMEMLKTHTQKKCPGCFRWAIWTPRKKRKNQRR